MHPYVAVPFDSEHNLDGACTAFLIRIFSRAGAAAVTGVGTIAALFYSALTARTRPDTRCCRGEAGTRTCCRSDRTPDLPRAAKSRTWERGQSAGCGSAPVHSAWPAGAATTGSSLRKQCFWSVFPKQSGVCLDISLGKLTKRSAGFLTLVPLRLF